jgi:cobalt-zinc-cadmium efflux system membrane fusion protein
MNGCLQAFKEMMRSLPTVFVLAALGGLAFWGHHSGWTLPKFSALSGQAAGEKDDWCAAHAVPESLCVECNPDLMPAAKKYGWCDKHGIPNCPLEHPDVAQGKGVEKPTPADLERAERALRLLPRPANSRKCKLHQRRIQFASKAAFDRAGIDVWPVGREAMTECIAANGEVTYDPTCVAHLSSRVPGTIWRMDKKVGAAVKRGEVLALIEAAEVGRAKSEYLQAVAQVHFAERTLHALRQAERSLAQQQIREAETALGTARIRLLSARQVLVNLGLPLEGEERGELSEEQRAASMQFLGLPPALRQALDPKTTTANLLTIQAPLEGVVVEREVVAGEVVDARKLLLVVADVRQMWLTLSVRQEEARRVALGQAIRFRTDDATEEVSGTVNWISTAVDEKTRTVKVRAELANADGRLRANSFGQGRIVLREENDAIVVPNEAVHWEGDCHVVFVRDKDFLSDNGLKVFHTRTVRPGMRNDKYTEILAGVLPGEVVASKGSGVLRSELLKNNLGEG